MCGIFGLMNGSQSVLSSAELERSLQTLFRLSQMRGRESSGIVLHDAQQSAIALFKAPVPATQLTKQPGYRALREEWLQRRASESNQKHSLSLMGHARLVTNGLQSDNQNNQPIFKDGVAIIHNGIVCNVDELWSQHPKLVRSCEVDTELLAALLAESRAEGVSIENSVRRIFGEMYGAASIGVLFQGENKLVLATNNGSLYWCVNQQRGHIFFASERLILLQLLKEIPSLNGSPEALEIHPLRAGKGLIVDGSDLSLVEFSLSDQPEQITLQADENPSEFFKERGEGKVFDYSPYLQQQQSPVINSKSDRNLLLFPIEEVSQLKRCSRCILPETFPFIAFDQEGVCNYCHSYKPMQFLGEDALEEVLAKYRSSDGSADCLVTFSGGRDSSYGLHLIKSKFKMNPISYTYDWGMVTDLARRNQSRLTCKLGVEHILVSADIQRKRENIRKNVAAWLKRPSLGTIPLFMAGDKLYFYYANQLAKANNLELIVLCENLLETTNFKTGFCGIRPNFGTDHTYTLSFPQKMRMLAYYGSQFFKNRSYLNSSLFDSMKAFASYYVIEHNYLNMYRYVKWEEPTVEKLLKDEYNWEISEDTPSTWRIGDGTAAFYNYIYFTLTGFSEFDTFRSNQIREGMLTREQALEFVMKENKPRFESLDWYLKTIGLEFNPVVRRINSLPRLYGDKLGTPAQ